MTSFIAAGGSGRSTSVIPAAPAAWSVTTIAFMGIASSITCLFGGSRTNADDRLPAAVKRPRQRGSSDTRPGLARALRGASPGQAQTAPGKRLAERPDDDTIATAWPGEALGG